MRTALLRVLSVVPNPGMVTARMSDAGRPRSRQARAQMSRASVESSPPEMPITSRWTRACSILLAIPAVWMEMISSQRSSRCSGTGRKGRGGLKAYSRPGEAGTSVSSVTWSISPVEGRGLLSLKELSERRPAAQPFKVHVRQDEEIFPEKARAFRRQPSVVRNEAMAAEDDVRRGFMDAGGRQRVGAEASAALLFDQLAPVGGLPGEFRPGGRLRMALAPCRASVELGGMTLQRSSQISTPKLNGEDIS